eukprot:UN30637
MKCYGDYCDSKKFQHYNSFKLGNDRHETQKFSEEQRSMSCGSYKFVSDAKCYGDFCDDLKLGCISPKNFFAGSSTQLTSRFSEEGDGTGFCKDGYGVVGMECKGDYCDNIKLKCRKMIVCMEGEYGQDGSDECFNCAVGTYNDVEGRGECKSCPAGKTSDLRSTSLEDCVCGEGEIEDGFGSCETNSDCSEVACQNGGTCSGGMCGCVNGFTGDYCEQSPGVKVNSCTAYVYEAGVVDDDMETLSSCEDMVILAAGTSCNIKCDAGYMQSGEGTVTCPDDASADQTPIVDISCSMSLTKSLTEKLTTTNNTAYEVSSKKIFYLFMVFGF